MTRYEKDGITYLLYKKTKTATILCIRSDNDVIIIPEEIKKDFTEYSIESIVSEAFQKSSIQSVIFPKSLKKISGSSFAICHCLQRIDLSKTQLEIIRNNAFDYSSLVEIFLPKSIKQIGERAFFECRSLETIEIPDDSDLCSIGHQAFAFSSLKNINLPEKIIEIDPTWFYHTPRVKLSFSSGFDRSFHWYDDNHTILVQNNAIVFADRQIKHAKIGSDVKHISDYAFNNCDKLKEVEFEPNSRLESIGIGSFACSSIESISIPKSVCGIAIQAFFYCNKLKRIDFPDDLNIHELNYGILQNTFIRTLRIPKNVNRVDETALADCKNLRAIEYLGSYLTFHPFAFNYYCCVQVFSCPNAFYFDFDKSILRRFSNTSIFFFKAPNSAT